MLKLRTLHRILAASTRTYATSDVELTNLCKTVTVNALNESLKSLRNPIGWVKVGVIEDTHIHRNTNVTNAHVFRREGTVNCSPMKVISLVRDQSKTKLWNEPVIESKILKNLGDVRVVYQKVTMPWPLTIRDLVFADALYEIEGGRAYVMGSIDYEAVPETSGVVRTVLNWGSILAVESEHDKEKSFVTYISSWHLKEDSESKREANYLIEKRNPFIVKLRKLLID